jgi:hypothetical protein
LDNTIIAVPPENRDGGGVKLKQPAFARGKANPPGREDVENVPVGKHQHITRRNLASARNHSIDAGAGIGNELTVMRAVSPKMPPRMVTANLCGGSTLVVAVEPFDEIVVYHRPISKPGEFGGVSGS